MIRIIILVFLSQSGPSLAQACQCALRFGPSCNDVLTIPLFYIFGIISACFCQSGSGFRSFSPKTQYLVYAGAIWRVSALAMPSFFGAAKPRGGALRLAAESYLPKKCPPAIAPYHLTANKVPRQDKDCHPKVVKARKNDCMESIKKQSCNPLYHPKLKKILAICKEVRKIDIWEVFLMEKKQMEKYLKMYPEIDREIERLKGNLEYYAAEKEKYQKKDMPEDSKNEMIEHIDRMHAASTRELCELMEAKHIIQRGLRQATDIQHNIVKQRCWQDRPLRWEDIANGMNYHRTYVEKQYKIFLEAISV
jgi:hypothetical protein